MSLRNLRRQQMPSSFGNKLRSKWGQNCCTIMWLFVATRTMIASMQWGQCQYKGSAC